MTTYTACGRPACDQRFPLELDHAGRPHPSGTPRRYCSIDCRELYELERKREARAAATAARHLARRVADLAEAELAVLPGMPAHPLLEEASHG